MVWELLDSIDLSMVFAQERSSFRKLGRIESQKRFLDDVYTHCTRLDNNFEINAEVQKLIFYKSINRADYDEFLNEIVSVKNYDVISLTNKSDDLNLELIEFIKTNYHYANVIEEENPYLQQALKIKLLSYCFLFNKLYAVTRKAVFFSDMQGPENFFCQAFKLCGIATATLQHGLYVEYSDDTNINTINYKNHVADYFLAWGACTANLIHKYSPNSKIAIVGKPTLIKIFNNSTEKRRGGVVIVTDQRIFTEYNIEMIRTVLLAIPEEVGNIFLKLHPSNDKKNYSENFPQLKIIDEIPDDAELVVGHTTSLLYEMFSQGLHVVRYRTDVESIYFPSDSEFDSVVSFNKARDWVCSNQPNSDSEYYIRYLGKESLEKYKNFLDYFNSV